MGMLAILLILVLLAGVIVICKQKLAAAKQDCQESFMALKIALSCRHQAAKYVLDASQLYLLNAVELKEDLAKACAEAEWALNLAARSLSEDSFGKLARAESRLTVSMRALQGHLKNELKHRRDIDVGSRMEMLEAAENDVIHARRTYNRTAERYNHLINRVPMSVCASFLGHQSAAALIKFEDNHAAQMSKYLTV